MPLALEMRGPMRAKSLREMENICNIPDQQLLKRFAEEHLPVIYRHQKFKQVLVYYVPHGLHDFILDPIRSRSFYPTSLIINKCQWAIKELESNAQFSSRFLAHFFEPPPVAFEISNASRLLEHFRNGSDNNDLLLFLRYLSEIHWFNIYTRGGHERWVTNGIIHWVCTTLVGRFLLPQLDDPLTAV